MNVPEVRTDLYHNIDGTCRDDGGCLFSIYDASVGPTATEKWRERTEHLPRVRTVQGAPGVMLPQDSCEVPLAQGRRIEDQALSARETRVSEEDTHTHCTRQHSRP
eukprot:4134224-Amphidinium_carterae.2